MPVASRIVAVFVFAAIAADAAASDACSLMAIRAEATVSVSDGSGFEIESLYHLPDHNAIRHLYPDGREQTIAVEGPTNWMQLGEDTSVGDAQFAAFALGHQFHALLLDFDRILASIDRDTAVEFRGLPLRGDVGEYPYGGSVSKVFGSDPHQPLGFVFELTGNVRFEVVLSDWREVGDRRLPFEASIDDGENVFDYRYTDVSITDSSPLWYFDALPAPAVDEILVHRLHRRLLAAHCIGDADMMADLSTESVTVANRGSLQQTSREDMRSLFGDIFSFLDYHSYTDIAEPVIEIAESGDIGWIAVNVRTTGVETASGQPFDHTWAWIMTVRNVDGVWLNAGNASNVAE